jgi:hypothetical protein
MGNKNHEEVCYENENIFARFSFDDSDNNSITVFGELGPAGGRRW